MRRFQKIRKRQILIAIKAHECDMEKEEGSMVKKLACSTVETSRYRVQLRKPYTKKQSRKLKTHLLKVKIRYRKLLMGAEGGSMRYEVLTKPNNFTAAYK